MTNFDCGGKIQDFSGIKPISELEQVLRGGGELYANSRNSTLGLLEKIRHAKPCSPYCDSKKLQSVTSAYAGVLSDRFKEVFGGACGIESETFGNCSPQSIEGTALEIIYKKSELPDKCCEYVGNLNREVTSKINELDNTILKLNCDYLFVLRESLNGAIQLTIYSGLIDEDCLKETARKYFELAFAGLTSCLLLPTADEFKLLLIESYNKKITGLEDYRYPLVFFCPA